MTVGEMIDKLGQFDRDAEVWGASMGQRFTWFTRVVRGAKGPGPDGVMHPIIQVIEDPGMIGEEGWHPKGRIQ